MYTLAGSILMLLSIVYLYLQFGSVHYFVLSSDFSQLTLAVQYGIWLAFFLSFAVKLPMVPVIYGCQKLMLRRLLQVVCY